MVNFRYHLVTITAIFLALAAGIVLGVAVSNPVAGRIQGQLEGVRTETRTIDAENAALRRDLDTWGQFGEGAAPGLLAGRLTHVPVLLVGVRGVDGQVARNVRETLTRSDADVLGTVWLTGKLKLDRTEDVTTLAGLLELPVLGAAQVRSAAISRLARQLAAPERPATAATTAPTSVPVVGASTTTTTPTSPETTTTTAARAARPTILSGLVSTGFVDVEDPAGGRFDTQALLTAATRFVVLSADGVDVPDPIGAIPFIQAVVEASATQLRTVAVEPGKPARRTEPEVRSAFIGPLRASGDQVNSAVSTVNDLEDFRGLAAMVLALADLGVGRVGHYGIGSGADRLVPEAG